MEFVAKISKQGDGFIIWIPQEYHEEVEPMKGKPLKINLEEVLK